MFDIFTLGDTQVFADILNGVAMMFSNSPILKGNGAFQLGYGAFLGALILLAIVIYKAAWQGKFDWRNLILPIILYSLLTIPKTTVVVHDIYGTEAPKVIDNVPLGLAMPASVMSGLAYYITEQIEKSFAVLPNSVDDAPLPKMTERGFLTPLQVMNSIRYDNINTDNPLLQKTMNQIYAKCIVANDAWNPDDYRNSKDPYAYFQSVIEQANTLVTFPVSQAGMANTITLPCNEAGGYVEKALQVHINGESADPTGLLNSNFDKHSFSEKLAKAMAVNNPYGKLQGVGGMTKYSASEVGAMLSSVSGLSHDEGRQFIMNVLFHPMVQTASNCMNDRSLDDISKCTAWVSTLEQWKDKSAASGTSFLKKMANGQNMMVMVGFMLFPFMVVMIMFLGLNSGKLVGGYVAFLLSNYLWLPMAAIVNFYSQYSLLEAINIFKITNPDGVFTINQAPELYQVLTNKLAVANNTMGMVPVLCSMLFGGMMWGVSALAKGLNPVDSNGYDTSINSKPITNSAAFNDNSSIAMKNGFGPTTLVGLGSTNSKASQAISIAKTNAVSFDDQISEKLERLEKLAEKDSKGINHQFGTDQGKKSSSETGQEDSSNYQYQTSKTDKTVHDGSQRSDTTINSQDNLQLLNDKSDSNAIKSSLNLKGSYGESVDNSNENKGKSLFARLKSHAPVAGIDGVISGASQKVGRIEIKRDTINDKTDTPTFGTNINIAQGINGGTYKESQKVTTEDNLSEIKRSNSANFKAQSYNEIIQNSTSNAFTISEKQEAARLASEVKSLSTQKAQSIQFVLAANLSDTELSGRLNSLTPSSALTHKALDRTDELGGQLVSNWDQLKSDAEKKLRLGGHAIPETIERVSIFVAAKHSGNADLMYSALEVVAPTSTTDSFKESKTLEKLTALPQDLNSATKDLEKRTNFTTSELKQAIKNNKIGQENALDEINKGSSLVSGAVGLTGQQFETPKQISIQPVFLKEDAISQKIESNYVTDANAISRKGPSVVDGNGNLLTPTTAKAWEERSTHADESLKSHIDNGDTESALKLWEKKQLLELGKSEKVTSEVDKFKESLKNK